LRKILIFGGSFDPIHNGHLQVALNLQKLCRFQEILFVPCKIPVLKQVSHATPEQRLAMLDYALEDYRAYPFRIDDCEIRRDSPSYMVTTLKDYRVKFGQETSLSLLLGCDAFADLPRWYHWQELISLCNLIIVERPVTTFYSGTLNQLLKHHETTNKKDLDKVAHGLIFRCKAGSFPYSSTSIREELAKKDSSLSEALPLPEKVREYIHKHKLYSPNPRGSTGVVADFPDVSPLSCAQRGGEG